MESDLLYEMLCKYANPMQRLCVRRLAGKLFAVGGSKRAKSFSKQQPAKANKFTEACLTRGTSEHVWAWSGKAGPKTRALID